VSGDEIGTELVRYDAMCRAIAEAYSVDEVKDIRDKAVAIAAYAKQANNHEAELQAIQIRVRAERKAGELSKEIEKSLGGRPKNSPDDAEGFSKAKVLKNAGISTQQASEWERLADVPEEEFEVHLATSKAPSARGIVYDSVRLHGSEPADTGRTLTGDDLANDFLEGVIKDITWLENKYSRSEFVKDALANARRTIAARLVPKPPQKGSGIHVVK
jgi:hypothetical protein